MERVQSIRLRSLCNAVNEHAESYSTNGINELPCMFMKTEATECSFGSIIIQGHFTILQKHLQGFLVVQTVVDVGQCFAGKQCSTLPDFFDPCEIGIYQRLDGALI